MNGPRTFTMGAGAGPVVSLLACALSVPPARSLIEQSMSWHMVVQMPLLLLGGWLLMGAATQGPSLRQVDEWNRFGLTGFIASQVIFAYWMLPVSIDRAVVLPIPRHPAGAPGHCLMKKQFRHSPYPTESPSAYAGASHTCCSADSLPICVLRCSDAVSAVSRFHSA